MNVIDTGFIFALMVGLVYVLYRVWTPVWAVLTLVLKLTVFGVVAVCILYYLWPSGLLHGYGIGSLVSQVQESRAIRIAYALVTDMAQGIANINWDGLGREWPNTNTTDEL